MDVFPFIEIISCAKFLNSLFSVFFILTEQIFTYFFKDSRGVKMTNPLT